MLKRAGVPFLLATVLLLVLLLNKPGVLAPDIKPEIYLAPWREAEALSRGWREQPKLGEPNFNVGLFPVAWLVGAIQTTGIGPDLSMRLLRWVLLLIGGWGAGRLYRVIAGNRASRVGQLFAGVLFVANPYMLTAGDFLANVLPAALLPWMALFLLRAMVAGGWRYPAAAALSFAGMSGMNAAVIPLIQWLCLPALVWFARAGLEAEWRQILRGMTSWLGLVLLLSVYWLVPTVAALSAGSHVTDFSETLRGIAGPSSFGEVVRGLGLWTLYGRDIDGPWQPGFSAYLTHPVVVVASFLIPILVVLSARATRGAARQFTLLLFIPAVILMVGVHTVDRPTPFGRLLLWSFEHVPGLAAFRTSHKVGAVMVLGMAILCALAIPHLLGLARRRVPIPLIAGAGVIGIVLSTWPAWTGGVYSLPLPVPNYWYQAAEALDEGPTEQRVWFVPGVAQPQYTWSEERPDDLNNALLARPSIVRITLPESSPYGASLLAAVDTGLQEGTLPVGALSAAARYLGVGDILVRNDVRWDKAGGARPLSVAMQVGVDPGLTFEGAHGRPGEGLVEDMSQPPLEHSLPPLQRYSVVESRDQVRTESAHGVVLVDGDGWALASLVDGGLLPSEPPFLLTSASDIEEVAARGPVARIVLTDSNRRREVAPNRLTNAYGPLLAPEDDPTPSIALGNADDQTVLRVEGGEVSATSERPTFGLRASWAPENAFDGNHETTWTFGDFGGALGQSVTLRAAVPVSVDVVDVDVPPTSGQRISEVEVRADDEVREATVPPDGRLQVTFPGMEAEEVTVTVTGVAGEGNNPVHIAEVSLPELELRRVARLPIAAAEALADLSGSSADWLGRTPVDIALSRVQGVSDQDDDEELRLDRDFTLPDMRQYRVYGLARPDRSAPDELLDALLGTSGDVRVTTSSRALGGVEVRGSRAFDASLDSGWMPGRGVVGEWLEAKLAQPRGISRIAIQQPENARTVATEVDVIVDGRTVATAPLSPGRSVVTFPRTVASQVRLQITEVEGSGHPVFAEIDIAGVHVTDDLDAWSENCVSVGTIDGMDLAVHILGEVGGTGPRLIAGCGPLTLPGGTHELRSVPGWTIDSLILRDSIGELAVPGTPGPEVDVIRRSASEYSVNTSAAAEPYFLVLSQNLHPSWRATMDGTALGPPMLVDGYAMGWWIDDLQPHSFEIVYSPQRASDIALAVSGAGLLLTSSLLLLPGRGRDVRAKNITPPGGRTRLAATVSHDRRFIAAWLGFVLGCWVFAGVAGLVSALAVSLWCRLGTPTSGSLFRASTVAMCLAPVAWIIGNLPRWGEVGPALATDNPAPSILVVTSLVLLLVAVWREPQTESTQEPASTRLL